MEENSNTAKIISQAPQWSFEGDCSLLAWMQELSQNLEQRATATSDSLQQLSVDVNRTAIALDNAANSLTALQYTQFVESRCHDDDETLGNTVKLHDAPLQSTDKPNTPNEVLETFLRKNLHMLHTSHEKYALDFEDSDEDEATATNNCIYQPKNPYNDELLPHIYGSKLWKEHWHVGLCDGSNEYSGDEASDAFSISSSSSAADNESYESNTANLSEWASSTSIPIEHKHPAEVAAGNDPATHTLTSDPAHDRRVPVTQRFPRNDDSDTCSTTSRSTTTDHQTRQSDEHDLFAALRHATPTTSTSASPSSSQQRQTQAAHLVQGQRNAAQVPLMLPPFFDATPPTDIFSDAASARQSNNSSESKSVPQRPTIGKKKGKPVNLFDDDDFNSFMTDVEEKPQTNPDQPASLPIPTTRTMLMKNGADFIPKAANKPKTFDLFAEPSNIEKAVQSQSASMKIEKPKEIKQRKPINLFDSPEGSPPNDTLYSSPIANENKDTGVVKPASKASITAKSLFDDDEDDDDFLNVFGSKKLSLPKRSTEKTLLFVDDKEGESQPAKPIAKLTNNIFIHTEHAVQSTAPFEKRGTRKSTDSGTFKESANGSSITRDSTAKASLFDDYENDISPKTTLVSAETEAKPQTLESSTVKPKNELFGGDLFGDEDNDDLDDLFKKQSTTQRSVKPAVIEKVCDTAEPSKTYTKEFVQQKKPLLDDNGLYSDEDDLFSDRLAVRDTNLAKNSKHVKKAETPKIDGSNKNSEKTNIPNKSFQGKSTTLFADDFDDEADDLFSVTPTVKQILNEKPSTDSGEIKDSLKPKTDKTQVNQATSKEVLKANQAPPKAVQKPAADLIQKLFEDDFESEENDLFNKANKQILTEATKDKNTLNSETNKFELSYADEPTEKLVQKSGAAIPIIEPQNENESNAIVSVGKPSNDANPTSSLLQKPDNSLATSIAQSIEHEEKYAAVEAPTKHLEFESDSEPHENVTTAAEATLKTSTHSATHTDAPPSLVIGSDERNNEYPSIFLDEPPDDDDFFTTLSNNKQPLSVSKLTLDLESDFYEPALPAIPTAAPLAAANNQLDGSNKQQPGSSDYGGLRLFSEIPPDDDGDDFSFAAPTKQTATNVVTNQRLHSVFYDDFLETLEAVQQIKDKQIAAQALFSDEPLPDEDNFDIIENVMPKRPQANREDVGENVIASVDQTARVKNVDYKSEGETVIGTGATVPTQDVTDRAAPKIIPDSLPAAVPPRSTAGKLQMPNIKINVQALLPGGGGKPSFKKSSTTAESTKPADTRTEIPKSSAPLSKERAQAASAEPANENILPSVCKTRVRAPAGRRPSTRRARQENYRQSLIADQADYNVQNVAFENLPQVNAPGSSRVQQQPQKDNLNISATQMRNNNDKGNVENMSKQATKPSSSRLNVNLFEDDDDVNDSLFSPTLSRNASGNTPGQSSDFNTPKSKVDQSTVAEKPIEQTRPVQAAVKGRPVVTKDFAEISDDEADDLFKGLHSAPMNTTTNFNQAKNGEKTTTKSSSIAAEANASKSLFGTPLSEDSGDDLFKRNKSALAATSAGAATTTQPAKSLPVNVTTAHEEAQLKTATTTGVVGGKLDAIFGSDDEDDDFLSSLKPKKSVASASSTAKQATQSSGGLFGDIESDEDDLFGGKSKAKQDSLKAKSNAATKTAASSTRKPTKATATLADNPLADLLNP